MVVTIPISTNHDFLSQDLLHKCRGGIFASPHNITIVLSGAGKERYVITNMNVFEIDNVQVDKWTCWCRCFTTSRDVSFHVKQRQRGRHTSMSVCCSRSFSKDMFMAYEEMTAAAAPRGAGSTQESERILLRLGICVLHCLMRFYVKQPCKSHQG